MSHTATYHTLRDLRERLLKKLSLVPMGTILNTPSGQYKTTIVDRVEGMEPTLAHLIPEMTANLVVPIAIAVYIFTIDWRMGLASLVTTIVGMIAASGSGKTYAQRWDGAVKVGKDMANADQILVLNKGHIVQQGTHEQLALSEGLYKDFLNARQKAASWKLA